MPILILLALLVSACDSSPGGSHHPTVDYYRAHPAERQRMVADCAKDPGTLKDSPACLNAREATRLEDVGSLRKLAPMGLPGSAGSPKDAGPR